MDGQPIVAPEIEALAREGLTPQVALRRLQAERLLMAEAERRGFAEDPAVKQVGRQAAVQALLDAEAGSVIVSDADLRQTYAEQRPRFEIPERRASVHVLAALPKNASPEQDAAAKAYAQKVLRELSAATDLDRFLEDQRSRKAEGVKIVAEQIPALDAHAKLVKPFIDAVFSLPAPGVVATPVRTIYGWHAIRVTEILAAGRTPFEIAAESLRSELLLSRRQQRVQQLIEHARSTDVVTISPNIAEALARLKL